LNATNIIRTALTASSKFYTASRSWKIVYFFGKSMISVRVESVTIAYTVIRDVVVVVLGVDAGRTVSQVPLSSCPRTP
jgi:hypothetical protein